MAGEICRKYSSFIFNQSCLISKTLLINEQVKDNNGEYTVEVKLKRPEYNWIFLLHLFIF